MAGEVVTFELTGADGEKVEKLGEVIAWRARALNTSTREATIATTITVLKSLRKATRQNTGKMKPVSEKLDDKLSVSIERVSDMYPSFNRKTGKWCIRNLSKHHVDLHPKPWWQVPPRDSLRNKSVLYRITLSDDRIEAWTKQKKVSYLVATDDASAKAIVEKRFGVIVKRYSSLAKSTLGRIMSEVSDKSVTLNVGRNAMKVVIGNSHVKKHLDGAFGDQGEFGIEVEDSLRFATDALEGGAALVNHAVMRGANSVVGYINKQIEKDQYRFFSSREIGKMETPFPPEMFEPLG